MRCRDASSCAIDRWLWKEAAFKVALALRCRVPAQPWSMAASCEVSRATNFEKADHWRSWEDTTFIRSDMM